MVYLCGFCTALSRYSKAASEDHGESSMCNGGPVLLYAGITRRQNAAIEDFLSLPMHSSEGIIIKTRPRHSSIPSSCRTIGRPFSNQEKYTALPPSCRLVRRPCPRMLRNDPLRVVVSRSAWVHHCFAACFPFLRAVMSFSSRGQKPFVFAL